MHLPLRGNHPPAGQTPGDGAGPRLDLVLLHHSLRFAPARWKQVRARLGPGRPGTADLPEAGRSHGDREGDREGPPVYHAARHYRENHDLFHQHLHAETLFMTGSAKVFRDIAHHFLDIAREGPDRIRVHGADAHFCTELHSGDGVLGHARELHIEYCDRWGP
ncbi:hypothetical protein [Streptomyces bambusae]|uniref:hypothetical protein n=1 Tax=Streptomyces bambusae TaxID=1550616 RepID=UPI0027E08222|nr:hypothetical protein [Streptomyces bambusae]